MTKDSLILLLKSLEIPVNEGIQNDRDIHTFPRIVFDEIVIEPLTASSEGYKDLVTYQVSLFSKVPRPNELLELRRLLKAERLNPVIMSEFVEQNGGFKHYTFTLDVLENVG